jgi:hypothetical protein
MNAMTKIVAAVVMTGATSFISTSANGWWDSDRRYDRWYGGPWYGGYPRWGPGWGDYRGWANYPGYSRGSTIIVNPSGDAGFDESADSVPVPRLPVPE